MKQKTESTPAMEISRYCVFDEKGNPLASHFDFSEAIMQWRKETKKQGLIFDLTDLKNITPKPTLWERFIRWLKRWLKRILRKGQAEEKKIPFLTTGTLSKNTPPMGKKELGQVERFLRHAGKEKGGEISSANEQRLLEYVVKLNAMDLPVYNIAKKRWEKTKKLVPIKKRRILVKPKKTTVFEEKTRILTKTERIPSVTPENDIELRRIRSITEIKRLIPRRILTLPREMFGRKLASHDLMVMEYEREEHSQQQLTESVPREVIVDEPFIEEYMDFMEVSQEPKGQLLYILRDVSGSMNGSSAYIAAALAIAVIGRNLENSSRYSHRMFESALHDRTSGETKETKEKLIKTISREFFTGGGTNIRAALRTAVNEIREMANPADQPEILLITDGQDNFSANEIYELIGKDIILHSVLVNGRNESLQAHSSTYVQIEGDNPMSLQLRQ